MGVYKLEAELIQDPDKVKNIVLKNIENSETEFYYYEHLLHCSLKAANEEEITQFYMILDPGVNDSAYIVEKLVDSNFFILKKHLKGLEA